MDGTEWVNAVVVSGFMETVLKKEITATEKDGTVFICIYINFLTDFSVQHR